MQGELAEIDVRSILHLVELGQRTGQLWVRTYGSVPVEPTAVPGRATVGGDDAGMGRAAASWFVFFVQGQIVYAGNPDAGVGRLKGMLDRRQPEMHWEQFQGADQLRRNAPEYGCLWALIEQRVVQPEEAREWLEIMIRETLFELLGLHQGSFIFEMGEPLTPELMAWETMPLVTMVAKQIQEWKQFYPQIQSPEQCPIVVDEAALRQSLPVATATAFVNYAERRLSLRQLAYALNRDILTVAKAIAPCLQRGWMTLTPWPPVGPSVRAPLPPPVLPTESAALPPQRIVCIDDAVTIGKLIVGMLEPLGYAVTLIVDPVAGLSEIFQCPPQLILCDIDMPGLDGYELCAMLRQSSQFHQTPIVMLTGRDGFIDRVRAKMVGATDYLAKPFAEDELVMLLEQYLPSVSKREAKMTPYQDVGSGGVTASGLTSGAVN
ncbi:DUF4388 domain-containing protein [filamentous cyanobacterium LEGE 11480]|uniref:DUF4388 domain-containing protein n=1 Tax=Romeriopsis navalis LEGE 11480 TaxID=2777977 RepID=A0A928VUA3_9CYAN|nr:response regulator [Romeriopsis navalis]MBE9032662.1 DUF4388 domain-containing protein [Romeriopsis navalis LEGE 11480]